MAYKDFKDLSRRTAADNVLRNHLILLKIKKYDGYKCGISSMVYNVFW